MRKPTAEISVSSKIAARDSQVFRANGIDGAHQRTTADISEISHTSNLVYRPTSFIVLSQQDATPTGEVNKRKTPAVKEWRIPGALGQRTSPSRPKSQGVAPGNQGTRQLGRRTFMHSDIEHYEAFMEKQKMRTIAAVPTSGVRDSIQSSQK